MAALEPNLDFTMLLMKVNEHQGSNYTHLKQEQKDALVAAKSHDVLCVLPTEFGKTVVIQLLPFINQGKHNTA